VIYSLKSWLGQSMSEIPIILRVQDTESGPLELTDRVYVDDVVRSGLAALYRAYLKDEAAVVGQLVLTCPNTFTDYHRKRLREIAERVFMGPMRIPRSERIKLISESDAVAFEYFQRLRQGGSGRRGEERVLVYDFGAGTLDLSVIRVIWTSVDQRRGSYPARWEVLARLGVPVAGNHLDGLIARLIHDVLTDYFKTPRPGLKYAYPIVAGGPIMENGSESPTHASASLNLWRAIRAAKECGVDGDNAAWDVERPFSVEVANRVRATVITVDKGTKLDAWAEAPNSERLGLRKVSTDQLFLDVPAAHIQNDERIRAFMAFVIGTVVDQCLSQAQLAREQIDTVIVSGRGIQWPGLRSGLFARFPRARCEDPFAGTGSRGRKEAVARGAIASMDLEQLGGTEIVDLVQPRLAALFDPTGELVLDDQWGKDKPIPWGGNKSVQFVQLSCEHSSYLEDQNSYRRHFYLDASEPFDKNTRWPGKGAHLIISVRPHPQDPRRIHLGNVLDTTVDEEVVPHAVTSSDAFRPPWPIGCPVLDPDEVYR